MQPEIILTAIGKAIFLNLLAGAIIWLLFLVIRTGYSKKPAILFSTAFAAQVVLLFVFLGCIYFFTAYSSQTEIFFAARLLTTTKPWNVWILQSASVFYGCMLLYFLLQFIIRYRNTGLLHHRQEKIPVGWKLFTEEHQALIGINKSVKIFLTKATGTPLTMGWLKPVILIPVSAFAQLSATQLEAVIIHELAHIKRRDYLLHLIAGASDILLCFNPFSRLLMQVMDTEREKACDDYVLQFKYAPVVYAEALLSFALQNNKSAFAAAAKGNTSQQLLLRIQRILRPEIRQSNYTFTKSGFMQFCLALLVPVYVICIQWLPQQPVASIVASEQKNTIHQSTGEINKVTVKKQFKPVEKVSEKIIPLMPPPPPPPLLRMVKSNTETPKRFSDIEKSADVAYLNAIQKSMQTSALEVEALLQQAETNAASEKTIAADLYGNTAYSVYNAGTEEYVITPEMFDALVDAWNSRKALAMPLANGDTIESVTYDNAASSPARQILQVITKDTDGKEHHFTLEIKIYQ